MAVGFLSNELAETRIEPQEQEAKKVEIDISVSLQKFFIFVLDCSKKKSRTSPAAS